MKKLLTFCVGVLQLLAIIGLGFIATQTPLRAPLESVPRAGGAIQSVTPQQLSAIERIGKIGLRSLRQYIVNNDKIGKVLVVQGQAVNGFSAPRSFIRIEVDLLDSQDKVLVSKDQYAGVSISASQLQSLDQFELEQTLSNQTSIDANNSNVAPGAAVEFMVAFYNYPEQASQYVVRVVDAKIPGQE